MTPISPRTNFLLALSMLKGVGPAALKKVARIDGFWDADIRVLSRDIPQIQRAVEIEGAWPKAEVAASRQIEAADRHGARILSPLDSGYPHLLADTKDDPFLLFIKGELAKDAMKSVAVIGTREPTSAGQVIAHRIARTFAEHGWSIVSGLALGCDAIAHRAALDAQGHTVAVLAHGLQTIAPSSHKELAEDILAAGGALVSEYPFGQGVQSQQFVKRDRTQAGMAQGVVMVQSDLRGGSLHASRAALDYARWLAVPYPTGKDVDRAEPKIQANLSIASGADEERASLLRCTHDALHRIHILRDRADILRLAGANEDKTAHSADSLVIDEPFASQGVQQEGSLRHAVEPDFLATEVGHLEQGQGEPSKEGFRQEGQLTDDVHALVSQAGKGPSGRAPAKRAKFHLVLWSKPSPSGLEIIQFFPTWIKSPLQQDPRAIASIASRLQHLQARLNEVAEIRNAEMHSVARADMTLLPFVLEEVLVHMKRTVDYLAQWHAAEVDVKVLTHSGQLSLLEIKSAQSEGIGLASALEELVKSLPLSVDAPNEQGTTRDPVRRIDEVEIGLDDLVDSFNTQIKQTLGVHPAANNHS